MCVCVFYCLSVCRSVGRSVFYCDVVYIMSSDLIQSISLLSCYLFTFLRLFLLLLLSLDTHNHVDDYCGTLDGVRKVQILALVTSPYNSIVALSFSLSQKQNNNKNTKELVDWSVLGVAYIRLAHVLLELMTSCICLNCRVSDD